MSMLSRRRLTKGIKKRNMAGVLGTIRLKPMVVTDLEILSSIHLLYVAFFLYMAIALYGYARRRGSPDMAMNHNVILVSEADF